MDNILTIENVSKSYTGHVALDDVSLAVPRGSIYGLLGPNGAGKTTLIRVINRITIPDCGRVLLDGKPIAVEDIYRIGYMPEERGLYKKMRVGDQAIFFARIKGMSKADAAKRLHAWFERLGNRRVVVAQGRGSVQRHGAEGAVHLDRGARAQAAHLRRTLLGIRPDQRQPAQRGDSGSARPRSNRDILDPQHGLGRGDMRPHNPYRQVAQHPLGLGRRDTPRRRRHCLSQSRSAATRSCCGDSSTAA